MAVGGEFDQLEFKRYIVRRLMNTSSQASVTLLTGPQSRPILEIRTDDIGHHLARNGLQRRCYV